MRGNIPPPADQVHIDLGALDERVRGTERAIDDVNGRLDNLGTQINNMSSSFAQQMTRISEKIDAKMQVKPTNWLAYVTAAAAIVALGITIGSLVMIPAFSSIRENAADIKERVTTKEFDEFGRNIHSREDKLSQLIEGLTRDKISMVQEFRAPVMCSTLQSRETSSRRAARGSPTARNASGRDAKIHAHG